MQGSSWAIHEAYRSIRVAECFRQELEAIEGVSEEKAKLKEELAGRDRVPSLAAICQMRQWFGSFEKPRCVCVPVAGCWAKELADAKLAEQDPHCPCTRLPLDGAAVACPCSTAELEIYGRVCRLHMFVRGCSTTQDVCRGSACKGSGALQNQVQVVEAPHKNQKKNFIAVQEIARLHDQLAEAEAKLQHSSQKTEMDGGEKVRELQEQLLQKEAEPWISLGRWREPPWSPPSKSQVLFVVRFSVQS